MSDLENILSSSSSSSISVKVSFFDFPETKTCYLNLDQSLEEIINALFLSNREVLNSSLSFLNGSNGGGLNSLNASLSASNSNGDGKNNDSSPSAASSANDYCLRYAASWELLTDQNYRKKLSNGDSLLFQLSPILEAKRCSSIFAMAVKGAIESENALKKSFYRLQRCLKEYSFFREFSSCNGLIHFMNLIPKLSGNTLSYALACLQIILDYGENEWKYCLSQDLLLLLVRCVFSNTLNVARNATAILVKLVTIGFYDFQKLCSVNGSIVSKLLDRLNSKENGTQCISMQLINTLLKSILNNNTNNNVQKEADLKLFYSFSLRRTISFLNRTSEEMEKHYGDFLRLIIQTYHFYQKSTKLDQDYVGQKLEEISRMAGMQSNQLDRWKRLGFQNDTNPKEDFSNVGILGVDHLLYFAKEAQLFSAQALGQISLPADRRCPFARLSIEVTSLLSSYWQIGSGLSTVIDVNPLVLVLEEAHCKFLETFCRLWREMEASQDDMSKFQSITRKLVNSTLASNRTVEELTSFLKSVNYTMIKELQMKELNEQDDDLLNQQVFRDLRERIHKENYEFIKQQRIKCLLEGSWFRIVGTKDRKKSRGMLRFCRLSSNQKVIYWSDFPASKSNSGENVPSMTELTERLELAQVSSLKKLSYSQDEGHCLALMSPDSDVLLQVGPFNESVLAEWQDGISILLGQYFNHESSSELIESLTDFDFELSLMDFQNLKIKHMEEIPVLESLPHSLPM